ncbi:MAG: DUF697 domain-containing protein [Opitutaceae bacterium]|nr:DUF697 domain-containing protein [Opitutaceae bacterium]
MSTEPPVSPIDPAVAAPVPPAPKSIDIIRRYVMWSIAAGAVPVPFVDVAAVTGVQLKMISALADHHKSPFDADRGKSLIGALFGTLGGMSIARGVLGSAIKSIPVVGTIGGFALVPAMSGAVTYGLGKVFAAHFEAGGTLLTFDAATMKEEFSRQIKAGEEVVHELKDKVTTGIKGP